MDYDKLTVLLRKKNIAVVPKESMRVRGYDVDTYRMLAKQTESIDYDCDFRDGVCRGLTMGGNGCCFACAGAFGYWHKEGRIDADTLEKIAGFYDARTGFFRKDAGCVIPRELRSPTCLYIFCSDEKMSGEEKALLMQIQYGAYWNR
ncbi:MAG: hypothetical protein A4E28_00672 [Methanocella sp. PtaU1.Bin125]|nr:MAG: hypothetical protein A4E28_00672 [Methanocella sp. PtaU1.Bin125]